MVARWNCSGPKLPRTMAESRGARTVGAGEPLDEDGAELGEEVPHGGEDEVVLAAEIVVGEGGRDAGAAGDLRHGHLERAVVGDLAERGADQRPAPRLGHLRPRHRHASFID